MGDLSAHFDSSEFAEHGTGRRHAIDPELIHVLEAIRAAINKPLVIVSGYRSPAYNRRVGGARHSLHTIGRAADLHSGLVSVSVATAAGARGLGVCDGWVVHVDTRRSRAKGNPLIFDDC